MSDRADEILEKIVRDIDLDLGVWLPSFEPIHEAVTYLAEKGVFIHKAEL